MSDPTELARAETRAADAKQRLGNTIEALQARLDPRVVAREAVDGIAETGKRHPGKVAGALALIAAFLGRRRIGALIGKARTSTDETAQPARARRVRPARPRPAPAKRKQ